MPYRVNKGRQLPVGLELPGLHLFVLQLSGTHTCVSHSFPPTRQCWEQGWLCQQAQGPSHPLLCASLCGVHVSTDVCKHVVTYTSKPPSTSSHSV